MSNDYSLKNYQSLKFPGKEDTARFLTTAEKKQLAETWNDTLKTYPDEKCIHQLFEIQVEKTPDAIAVVYENHQITYYELNKRSCQLAHQLQKMGVIPKVIIGVCVRRSVDLVVSLLAVLKAGGAFVLLEPDLPPDRLCYILEDSDAKILIADQSYLPEKYNFHCTVLFPDTVSKTIPSTPLATVISPDDPVYAIFTSGTTGNPKGMLISHRALVNYATWIGETHAFTPDDSSTWHASVSFDGGYASLWGMLLHGGTLHVISENIRKNPTEIVSYLVQHNISFLKTTPLFFGMMLNNEDSDADHPKLSDATGLRLINIGGERINPSDIETFLNLGTGVHVINQYGPAEATIGCITYRIGPKQIKAFVKQPVIGKPIMNMAVYIVDEYGNLVPVGVPGEICIAGIGLTGGYLKHPELTYKKFFLNPFKKQFFSNLVYRTGDMGRRLPDGNIEFIGRNDHQVKIRGYRIEPGEIVTHLLNYKGMQNAVVTAGKYRGDHNELAAYVISQDTLNAKELRSHLQQKLPEYMIPSYFIQLDKLPLTANGKVNRKVLPNPIESGIDSGVEYIAPRNKTEKVLVNIWQSVLEIQQAGVNDNFFDFGTHSLLLVRFSARISDTLGIALSLKSFYRYPTIASLAKHIDNNDHITTSFVQIQKKTITGPLLLSHAQQGMWLFEQLNPGTAVFHIARAYHIKGDLHVNILSRSLNAIIQRHEVLRTVFTLADDVPVQVIRPPFELKLTCENFQNSKNTDHQTDIQTWINTTACEPFNLEKGPLIRSALLRIADDEYIFALTMHHIISDGWSVGVFIKELNSLYSSYQSGQPVSLPDLPIQYAHFAIWQRERYKKIEKRLFNYWKNQLKAPLPKMEWPVDNVRQGSRSFSGARCPVKMSQNAAEKLKAVSRLADATLFMTLLAIYEILLYQFTGQTDLMVGAAVASRNSIKIEPLIGLFMNTLAIRTDISENLLMINFIENIKQVVLESYAYDEMPYLKLAEILQPNSKHDSLIQTLFLMQTMDIPHIAFPGITAEKLAVDTRREYTDLTLELYDTSEGINGWFEYSTDLFDEHTIIQLANYFQILAESIGDYPNQRINELAPLERNGYPETHLTTKISVSEWHHSLAEWNNTQVNYPKSKRIHQLFEEQVEKTPDAVAVMFEGQELTYRELNCRANQLAHYLRESGVGAEVLVGICIKPSLELIVSLLGVLKADSVYVPLDPNYPQERIVFMVEDSKVQVILTLESLTDKISFQQTPLICLDRDWDAIGRKNIENPYYQTASNDLVYVIYTSGSTGSPKAVFGAVRGVLNRLYWGWQKLPFEADEICCQKTSINFVDHVAEIFSPLLKGIPLIVIPDHIRGDILELMDVLSVQKVTRIVLVPSLLKTMLENAPQELALFRQLRYVICSGETLPLRLAEVFHQKVGSARLVNLYGSSEVAADVTCFEVKFPLEDAVKTDLGESIEKALKQNTIPIGKPISNIQIYIMDKYGNLLPPSVIGELYVGGDGLAKGYLNQPELTQKAFIPNPFTKSNGNNKAAEEERLFRTGDLARWLPDGNIEFHGRVDHQVKLRGFRIELGEIEAVLIQHETVSEAVVVVHERDDNKFLAAYITEAGGPKTEDNVVISELRALLRKCLPDYMIPNSFTVLDRLPLTPNGKTDRSALPAPEPVNREQKQSYAAPRDSLEQQLTVIWEKVLKINPIGVHDNFFHLGGNSLAAVMLLNKIGKTFKKKLPPVTLYQVPSVAQFAAILRQKNFTATWRMIEPIQLHGKRLPFFFLGSIERAKALAPRLGSDQPFFRLNVLGFQHKEDSSVHFSEIAKQAYREIGAIQPEGPYFFGAFCNNAVLAIKIAQLLNTDKQSVAFMGVFDLFWRKQSKFFGIERHYYNFSQFGFQYLTEKIKAKIENFRERRFVARIRRQARLCQQEGKPIPRKLADILLFEKIDATFEESATERYEGRITHFMASEWRVSHSPLLDSIATDGVEVHIIDGCHDNMFFEPQVIQLGRQLKICLDRKQPKEHKTQS